MDKILSVIIPSYNVEKYLDKCVKSLTDSKFLDEIEILIVNDGSKDKTLEIANLWSGDFPQSVKIIDKENGGHGSTINRGVAECTGKFFKVVDSDDWVDTEEFDKLVEKLHCVNADLVVCDFNMVFEKSKKIKKIDRTSKFKAGEVISYEEYVLKNDQNMHAFTYKTESYRKANIQLTEKCFFVDMQFIIFPLATFETAVCFPFNVYQYRLEREGQSVSKQGFLKHVDDHRKVMLSLCEFYKNFPDAKRNVKKIIKNTIASHIFSECTYVINPKATTEEIKKFKAYKKTIKKNYPDIYKAFAAKIWFMNIIFVPAYLRNMFIRKK